MSDGLSFSLNEQADGRSAVLAEGCDPTGRKVAGWLPVSDELIADAADLRSALDAGFRRLTHPWEYADRNPFPSLDPSPWFTRRLNTYRAGRRRVADAWRVLRHGLESVRDDEGWM